jgi:ATP-dependent exoDNAse (exonuclease V) alpha subunit
VSRAGLHYKGDRHDGVFVLLKKVRFLEDVWKGSSKWQVAVKLPPVMYAWALTIHFVQGRTVHHNLF